MSALRKLLALALALSALACQLKPTQVKETQSSVQDPATTAAKILEASPVVLDVQSPIDYGISHVPGAINVRWEDFSAPGLRPRGLVDPDRFGLARRLALWGIDPAIPVVVVGLGPEGRGEEGRVAWTLRLLGLNKIETGSIRLFRGTIPREHEGRPENRPIWKPESRDAMELTPAQWTTLVAPTKSVAPSNRLILDLRHPNELVRDPLRGKTLNGQLLARTWREFYSPQGQPDCAAARALNVEADREIFVIDEDGVGAGAVGFVLERCGFTKTRVLSPGLRGI